MKGDQAVILIGPMGSGKSEVGAALAERTGRLFLDTDVMVTERDGRSIQEIFDEGGEALFRQIESEAVAEAVKTPGAVIACGGGVVVRSENVAALRRAGEIIYLRVGARVAATRIGDGSGRPLLRGDPPLDLAAMIEEREPLYIAAAHHVVDAEGVVTEVVEKIEEVIG